MQAHIDPRGITACWSSAGLGKGTVTAATIRTNAPNGAGTDYSIEGLCYHKIDTDNIAVTAHAQQAAATKCLYLVQIDSAGVISTKKGTEVLTASLSSGVDVLHWPFPDKDKCPIGAYKVETNGSTTFTNATTDLSAAGITATYYNFGGGMPHKPLTS